MSIPFAPENLKLLNGSTAFGTYVGPMGPMVLHETSELRNRSAWWVKTHVKRWVYAIVVSEHHMVAMAVVHLGYAGTAFVAVLDRKTRAMCYELSSRTLPGFVHVAERSEEGCEAQFRCPRARMAFLRPMGSSRYQLSVDTKRLRMHATMETEGAPLAVSAISPVPEGAVNMTTKRVLMPTHGALCIDGKTYPIESAWGGMDYTHGALARRTEWRWAFGMGTSKEGKKVAFNLVDGFNQGKECAVWIDDAIVPTVSALFDYNEQHPASPWRIRTPDGLLELKFIPDAIHEERIDMRLVRSSFLQPMGAFSGTIRVPGEKELHFDSLSGVVEDQRVIW